LEAWRFECVALAGVARPMFLMAPWAIASGERVDCCGGWLFFVCRMEDEVFGC
jgi:hypothetical protein